MHEQRKVLEAWMGVGIIVLSIGGFLIFNKSQVSVTGDESSATATDTAAQLVYESDTLQARAEKLEKLKGQTDFDKLQAQIDQQIAADIETKTTYAPGNNKPFLISNTVTEDLYKKQFAEVFGKATSSGMGLELVYFISQVNPDGGQMLPLSPQDTESVYRVATEYEIFADAVQKLPTPPSLEKVGEITSLKAREVAFYLRKMMEEKDPFIYSVLFTKYTDAMSYIVKINKAPSVQTNELEQIKNLASSTEVLLKR
jgi:hypothetical protein